jgi:hypothetical protein
MPNVSRRHRYVFFSFLLLLINSVVAQSQSSTSTFSVSPLSSHSPFQTVKSTSSSAASLFLSSSPAPSVSVLVAAAGPEIILIPGGQTGLSADFPFILAGVFILGIVFTIVIYFILFKDSLSLNFNLWSIFAAHTAGKKKEIKRLKREKTANAQAFSENLRRANAARQLGRPPPWQEEAAAIDVMHDIEATAVRVVHDEGGGADRKILQTVRNRGNTSKSPTSENEHSDITIISSYDNQPPQFSSPLRNNVAAADAANDDKVMVMDTTQKKLFTNGDDSQSLRTEVRKEAPFRVAVVNYDDTIDKLLPPPSRMRSAKVTPITNPVIDPVTSMTSAIPMTKPLKNTNTHLVIVADPIAHPILWSPTTTSNRSADPEITDQYSFIGYKGSSSSARSHAISSSLSPRINRLANVSLQSISTIDGMNVSVIKT